MKKARLPLVALPFFDSALMLTLIQPPIAWSFFAWVAMVSFALGCTPAFRARTVALAALIVGFLYWLGNLYWIAPITIPGWIGLCFYVALLWPLLALGLRFCRSRNIPMTLALPILVVGAERLQGFPLGGFYWRLLGHSQYANLAVIQIADIFGTAGVSFLVAMANGLLADVVLFMAARRPTNLGFAEEKSDGSNGASSPHDQTESTVFDAYFAGPRPSGRSISLGVALVVMAIVATLLYGRWRLEQTQQTVTDGPLVAALQSNVPQSVKDSFKAGDDLFAELLGLSRQAAAAGAELIAWPETMVQGLLQPELWPFLRSVPEEDRVYHRTLAQHAKDTAYVLVGAYGGEILTDAQGDRYLGNYNSAFLYRPDGLRDPNRYDKIHLVLFGEYIPFRRSFNWLYQQLKRFTPQEYQYDYSLEHGTHYTVWAMTIPIAAAEPNAPVEPNATYHFGAIICYEDTIPYVARRFALDKNGRKRVDWLVNISNDGWFVHFRNGTSEVTASTELAQHAAICAFRAVENRLPVLRSVNTGISCLIDSTGQIRNGYRTASEGFPAAAMHRTGMSGWFLDRMPIDRRVTLYSRFGPWLDTICAALFVVLLAGSAVARVVGHRLGRHQKG